LLHLTEEVLHGVLHFETKGWRTLPLLVARPGLLTRRYIDGQRTRYVPPLHMFVQLRETYQLSIFASLWRTMALLCVAGAAFSLFLTFIVTMTLH
jgi:hypothetical protein